MAECKGKKKFDTASEADKAKIRIWGNDPNCDFNDLHSYRCPQCGGWHIGHKSYYIKKLEGIIAQGVDVSKSTKRKLRRLKNE